MNEDASWDGETPAYVIDDLGTAARAAVAIRQQGAIIADFRAVDDSLRIRVADTLNGAALANGFSPFLLAEGVRFLTTQRPPSRTDYARYRDEDA